MCVRSSSGEPSTRVGVRGVWIADGVEVIERSAEWRAWWERLNAWWPTHRRITRAEEREWFLVEESVGVEYESQSLGFG